VFPSILRRLHRQNICRNSVISFRFLIISTQQQYKFLKISPPAERPVPSRLRRQRRHRTGRPNTNRLPAPANRTPPSSMLTWPGCGVPYAAAQRTSPPSGSAVLPTDLRLRLPGNQPSSGRQNRGQMRGERESHMEANMACGAGLPAAHRISLKTLACSVLNQSIDILNSSHDNAGGAVRGGDTRTCTQR
jgi:hypothetical protein